MTEFITGYWDETTPSGSSEVRQTDDEFVSLKSSVRSIIGNEHEFNTAAADHVRGTHKQGSARAYHDAESNISVSGTSYIGRLYTTSDTSRVFVVPESGFTMFLGGSLVAEVTSFADDKQPTANYPGQNARWVMQTGRANVNDSGATRITFSPAYSDRPTFFVTSGAGSTDRSVTYSMADGSYATIYGFIPSTGAASNIAEVDWLSLGTVDF